MPVGPAGTLARQIYRQFVNMPETYVGQIADNTTTTFIDNTRSATQEGAMSLTVTIIFDDDR